MIRPAKVIKRGAYCLYPLNNEFTRESTILNNRAYQNPSTVNPEIIDEARSTMNAFMTNRNKPNVNIVIGIVRMIITGLIMTLSSDMIIATKNAVRKESTATPGSI